MTFSVAKSYLGLLAGLAHADGLIPDLDGAVGQHVPGPWFESPHNAAITWRNLLQQTSEWQGTLWGKPDTADHNRSVGGAAERQTAEKGEERRLAEPGSFYEYNDVRVNLLAACLTDPLRTRTAGRAARADHGPDRRLRRMGVAWLHRVRARAWGPCAALRVRRRSLGAAANSSAAAITHAWAS